MCFKIYKTRIQRVVGERIKEYKFLITDEEGYLVGFARTARGAKRRALVLCKKNHNGSVPTIVIASI